MVNFNSTDIELFKIDLLQSLLRRADIVIRPQIPSTRLRQAMFQRIDTASRRIARGSLFIPHYWAIMVHDGHRAFKAKQARFLVYFADENDDPRKPNPERLADQRRLTKDEFQAGLERNRALESTNPTGGPMQHMIIVKTPRGAPAAVGPTAPSPFFSQGGKAFERQVDDLVFSQFEAFVIANLVKETKTITIFL
jgi:hypothetical protein